MKERTIEGNSEKISVVLGLEAESMEISEEVVALVVLV